MNHYRAATISIFLAAGISLLMACQPEADKNTIRSTSPLSVSHAWVRNMPPGRMMTAAYAEISNTSNTVLRISHFTSPQFSSVSLHETITDEQGMSKMQEIKELVLQPGETVVLQPGGKHIMLMGMRGETLNDGSDNIRISFGPDLAPGIEFLIK